MKKFSLLLAAAAVVVALAISGSASARDIEHVGGEKSEKILINGRILSVTGDGSHQLITIVYEEKMFMCRLRTASAYCFENTF